MPRACFHVFVIRADRELFATSHEYEYEYADFTVFILMHDYEYGGIGVFILMRKLQVNIHVI